MPEIDHAKIAEARKEARKLYPELFDDIPESEYELPAPRDPEEAQDQLDTLSRTHIAPAIPEEPEPSTAPDEPQTLETSGPGFMVFWSVEGGGDRAAVETALAIIGHADIIDNFPSAPSPVAALQRAKSTTQGHLKGIVLRNVRQGEVAIISETAVSSDGKCDYEHGVSVCVPKSGETSAGINLFQGNTPQEYMSAVGELVYSYNEHIGKIEAADLSAWLTACMADMHAVSLRPRGGVYFVPAEQGASLMKLKACSASVGNVQIYIMSLATDEITKDSVATATAEAFLGDFKAIERDVSNWTNSLNDSKRPGRGLNAHSEQLTKLKDRVDMYTHVLAAQKSKLSTLITGASKALQTTFSEYIESKKESNHESKSMEPREE